MRINLSSFLQWRFNIYLIQKLGWTFTYFYIYLLGKLYFFIQLKEKRRIAASIHTVFAERKKRSDIKSITRAVFRGICFHYYEKIFNAFSPVETLMAFFKTHINSQGTEALDTALAGGKGVLLVTGHLGGVEYIPTYLGANNYPVTIVVRFSSPNLRAMSLQKADKYGAKIIDADTTPNIMKAIFSHLTENRIVIIQCDEIDEWRLSRKDKILFLGKQTYLDKTINVLSKRTAAPVVFGIMHRGSNHRYKFMTISREEITKQFQQSVETTTGAMVMKFLEHYIYLYPDEWYQWKKYAAIETVPIAVAPVQAELPVTFLEPSFGKLS
ncbi:lysophospholipid acyltransferase family protein [Thermodesulfobacteriota bacterium]